MKEERGDEEMEKGLDRKGDFLISRVSNLSFLSVSIFFIEKQKKLFAAFSSSGFEELPRRAKSSVCTSVSYSPSPSYLNWIAGEMLDRGMSHFSGERLGVGY